MKNLDEETLVKHLKDDLKIQESDLVFLFSGIWGLGKLKNGLETITNSFKEAIPRGVLIVPTFSYSWNDKLEWNPLTTDCQLMGAYSRSAVSHTEFVRSDHPIFSVSALKTPYNSDLITQLFDIDETCFGERSIFGNIVRYANENAKEKKAWIILLGGALNDCLFRCTFIHYVQQKNKAIHRFEKKFYDPQGSGRHITQYVRYFSRDEYLSVNNLQETNFEFPMEEDFSRLGEDLQDHGVLIQSPIAYSNTRMVRVDDFCRVYQDKLLGNPWYCVKLKANTNH